MIRMQDAANIEAGNLNSASKGATEMDTVRLALRKEAMNARRRNDDATNNADDTDDDESASGTGEPNEGGSSAGGDSGGGGDMDKIAVNRRAKRLAMNRESARNRRKRKKVLIQTLEGQVAEISKANQNYQLANETLSTRVRTLENELMVARSTISQLSNSTGGLGGVPGSGGGNSHVQQLQQRFGGGVPGNMHNAGVPLSASLPTGGSNDMSSFDQFRGASQQGGSNNSGGAGDSLGRLMQAQFEQYALQGGASGMPFGMTPSSSMGGSQGGGGGGSSQFNDESLLRLQALSQANRETATLGSMMNASRFGLSNNLDDRNSFGLRGAEAGLGMNQEAFSNMLAQQQQDMNMGDAGNRFRMDLPTSGAGNTGMDGSPSNTRSFDARNPQLPSRISTDGRIVSDSGVAGGGLSNNQQLLEGLLRQQQQMQQQLPRAPDGLSGQQQQQQQQQQGPQGN